MVFMIIIDDYYQKAFISDIKMGCFISRNEPKIKIFDLTPPGNDFDYLRPQGTTTFSIDRTCNVPLTWGHKEPQRSVLIEHVTFL